MDEVISANYRPAVDAAVEVIIISMQLSIIFALIEKMASGLFVTSLINVKSNTIQPYTCVVCA